MTQRKAIIPTIVFLILISTISKNPLNIAKSGILKAYAKSDISVSANIKPQITKKHLYIMLDPGHGGKDYGTVSGKLFEKNINLNIANLLKGCLLKDGYNVLMTRDKDVFPGDKSNIIGSLEKKDLDVRTRLVNKSPASLFISLHVDCDQSQPERNGSIVYYNPSVKGSQKLAVILQNELNKVSVKGRKRTSNLCSIADFYILKKTDIPGVLVETGFISNKTEKGGFLQDKFRTDLAYAIYNGINKFNKASILNKK